MINFVHFFVLFLAAISSLSHVSCQNSSETNFQSNYDFVRLITGIGNQVSRSQDFKAAVSDLDLFSSFNQYKNLFTNWTIDESLINLITETPSDKCSQDIVHTVMNLRSEWAIQMLDAFGKPGSGILEANLKWLGDFYECTHVYSPPEKINSTTWGDFHGKYCTLQVGLNFQNKSFPVTWGVCLPETCNLNNLVNGTERVLNKIVLYPVLHKLDSHFTVSNPSCNPISRKLTNAAIGMIVLLSIFVLLALIGSLITAYEYCATKYTADKLSICSDDNLGKASHINDDFENQSISNDVFFHKRTSAALPGWVEKVKPFFNCFCLFTNGKKLLDTSSSEGQLPCLHGIRFLSMSWVIVCHTYAFCFTAIGNLLEMVNIIDVWPFQLILNGFYSVDSFFELSGFLVAYLFFKEAPKTDGKVPWLYFYLHRYIRLTPVYMIVLGFNAALTPYLGSGPFWVAQDIDPVCQKNWWWNLLYINNFTKSANQCMAWSWYLANDMQFFIISPLFLVMLWKYPKVGYSLLGLFFSIAFATNFGITYHFNLVTGLGNFMADAKDINNFLFRFANFFDKIYIKPYTRISPYLVGIGLASYLNYKKKTDQTKDHWITLTCGWIISTVMTLACFFGPFHREQTLVEASFYNALNRSCYAFSLAWVMYVCLTDQSDAINRLLSWKFFIPLSRLTYCAYLIHPIIYTWYFLSLKTPLHFSQITMVTIFLGLLVVTYALSFIVSLLFESPVIRLEKEIRTKSKSQRQ